MVKYIAEIQDASGNTVYPTTQWGAITDAPDIDSKLNGTWTVYDGTSGYKGTIKIHIAGNKVTAWLFGKVPKVDGAIICYLPINIMPKTDYWTAVIHRTIPAQPVVLQLEASTGKLMVKGNADDVTMVCQEITWIIGGVYA